MQAIKTISKSDKNIHKERFHSMSNVNIFNYDTDFPYSKGKHIYDIFLSSSDPENLQGLILF